MQIDAGLVHEIAPRGVLRATVNLGNPVLASSRTSSEIPAGVSVDLAREFARRLGVAAESVCYPGAGEAGAAIAAGAADIGFLAIDPARAETLHFTAPYVLIEGAYLVREDSPVRDQAGVDREGVQVVVGNASAYDLFLRRHLKHAHIVRVALSEQVVDAALTMEGTVVAAGVRQQLEADAARVRGLRMLEGRFMVIRQAACMPRGRSAAARACLDAFIADAIASGFVQEALTRHGIEGAAVAPPGTP